MRAASRRTLSRRSNGLKPRAARITPTTSDRIASLIRTRAGFPPKNRSINQLPFIRPLAGGEPFSHRTIRITPELVRAENQVKEKLKHVSVSASLALEAPRVSLPEPFAGWFRARGWRPHDHQVELLEKVAMGRDALLIAPTGGGKTLAGFLPSLVDLACCGAKPNLKARAATHTRYVSQREALAVDIARNLVTPIEEMGLRISLETRTGDTPPSRRARQRISPPDILLTPEQIALMLSHQGAAELFGS